MKVPPASLTACMARKMYFQRLCGSRRVGITQFEAAETAVKAQRDGTAKLVYMPRDGSGVRGSGVYSMAKELPLAQGARESKSFASIETAMAG